MVDIPFGKVSIYILQEFKAQKSSATFNGIKET